MKLKFVICLCYLTSILLFSSCKNYYNDTIEWIDHLGMGLSTEAVQDSQPHFVKIDWQKPDTVEDQVRYKIIRIKGNRDLLNMEHYLVFDVNGYVGRESHK